METFITEQCWRWEILKMKLLTVWSQNSVNMGWNQRVLLTSGGQHQGIPTHQGQRQSPKHLACHLALLQALAPCQSCRDLSDYRLLSTNQYQHQLNWLPLPPSFWTFARKYLPLYAITIGLSEFCSFLAWVWPPSLDRPHRTSRYSISQSIRIFFISTERALSTYNLW